MSWDHLTPAQLREAVEQDARERSERRAQERERYAPSAEHAGLTIVAPPKGGVTSRYDPRTGRVEEIAPISTNAADARDSLPGIVANATLIKGRVTRESLVPVALRDGAGNLTGELLHTTIATAMQMRLVEEHAPGYFRDTVEFVQEQ